jgi:hypothetical protein
MFGKEKQGKAGDRNEKQRGWESGLKRRVGFCPTLDLGAMGQSG